MLEHTLDRFADDNGFSVAVCGCGWKSSPCPDAASAVNFWGQHLLVEAGNA